jgi:hypothetical protein
MYSRIQCTHICYLVSRFSDTFLYMAVRTDKGLFMFGTLLCCCEVNYFVIWKLDDIRKEVIIRY